MNRTRVALPVPADHPAYAGHFPGMPVLPGVVLLDEALHAIGSGSGLAADACRIASVKFLSPVAPGEALVLDYEVSDNGAVRFEILAGERRVASGSLRAGEA